jgi:hypothetical protein
MKEGPQLSVFAALLFVVVVGFLVIPTFVAKYGWTTTLIVGGSFALYGTAHTLAGYLRRRHGAPPRDGSQQ